MKYTEEDMAHCLLKWCLCTDPSKMLESIIEARFHECKRIVNDKSLYRHFAKEILVPGCTETTSLKKIQVSAREMAYTTRRIDDIESAMAVFESQANNVIKEIFMTKKKKQEHQRNELHQGNLLLTADQEEYLVQLCTILGASGHGLDRDEILMCIDLIASTGGQSHSQSAVDGFFKRHGQLKLLGSSGIDPQRASQANEAVRDAYFCKLDAYINILYSMGRIKWKSFADVPNKFIYNMDELSSDTTKRRKKSRRGCRQKQQEQK